MSIKILKNKTSLEDAPGKVVRSTGCTSVCISRVCVCQILFLLEEIESKSQRVNRVFSEVLLLSAQALGLQVMIESARRVLVCVSITSVLQ